MSSKIVSCNNCGSLDHAPLVAFKDGEGGNSFGNKFTAVVCKNCGLCFLNPQPSFDDYLKYYQRKGSGKAESGYSVAKEDILNSKYHHKFYAGWLAENAGISKSATIVDMGCGFGTLLYYLQLLGYENLLGIEASKNTCETGRILLKVNILNQDALASGFEPESIDMVIGVAFIEHLNDPLSSLKEIAKFIKPGGLLYLNTHDLKNFTARKGFTSFFKFVHPYYFTELTLTSLLTQSGFRVVKSTTMPSLISYSNPIFPENCFHGELNIIAKKDVAPTSAPLKEDYRTVLDNYRKIKYRDWPYALCSQLIFSRWGWPLRMARQNFFSGLRKDARSLKSDFYSRETGNLSPKVETLVEKS